MMQIYIYIQEFIYTGIILYMPPTVQPMGDNDTL